MADLRKHSSTSNIIRFSLRHATTGVGLTGLSSASSGLIISTICDNEATATTYTVAGSTIESITTLGTFAAPTATKCRFKEVDATNHKGLYEFQFADARFSVSSAKKLIISVTGATNLLDADYEIQLTQFDMYTATQKVDLDTIKTQAVTCSGSVTIPAATLASTANITAATGVVLSGVTHTGAVIPTVSTVTGDVGITQAGADKVWSTTTRALTDKADFALSAASRAAVVDEVWDEATSGHQTAGTTGKALTDASSAGDPWSTALPGAYGAGTAGNILGNRLVGTIATGTHNPQSGDAYAIVNSGTYGNSALNTKLGTPAGASVSADVAAVKSDSGTILNRLGAWTGTGINNILGAFRALCAKAATLTPTDISTGTTFDNTTDSVEALRDRGDTAWITATGFSTHTAADVWSVATRTLTDKAGFSIGTGGIGAAAFAAGAIDAAAIATDAGQELADAFLLRKLDRSGTGTDVAEERTVVNALRGVRNKQTISGGTLTVTKEDDTATAWTAAVTTTAGNPLSGVDPT